jgi:methyl-accepting chemotaxis protein
MARSRALPVPGEAGDLLREAVEPTDMDLRRAERIFDLTATDVRSAMIELGEFETRDKSTDDIHARALARLQSIAEDWRRRSRVNLMATRIVMGSGIVIALAAALVSLVSIQRGVAEPIGRIARTVEDLARGRTDVAVPIIDRLDEIGTLARAVRQFQIASAERSRLARAPSERPPALSRQSRIDDAITKFRAVVSGTLSTVGSNVDRMQQAASLLATISLQTKSQARGAAGSSSRATQTARSIVCATEALTLSSSEIGRQVERSAEAVSHSKGLARDTDAKVEALAKAAERIGHVVRLIQDIAAQTNLAGPERRH